MYDRGKDHSSSNFSGYTDLPPSYRSLRIRELRKARAEERLKKLKESGRYQEITAKKELYWSVAFLPAIPVVVIGKYILVAVGSTMLLQVKDEDGNYVTLAEYTSDNLTELLNSISDEINSYYQNEGKENIEEIRESVSQALNEITVTEKPDNQIYRTPSYEQRTVEHTGGKTPEVETETPGFDTEAGRETVEQQNHTGHIIKPDFDLGNYIFESRRRNVEGHDNEGGHTIERHIGKSVNWLQKRASTLSPHYEASSFKDMASANLTQARAIKENRDKIAAWLKSRKKVNLRLVVNSNKEIGIVVNRSGKVWKSEEAYVILSKDSSNNLGYKILTSYPVK